MAKLLLVLAILFPACSIAGPLSEPGEARFRSDLQLLSDSGVINLPLATWPLSNADIYRSLSGVDDDSLPLRIQSALHRMQRRVRVEMVIDAPVFDVAVSGAIKSRFIRTFESTPREEGEAQANFRWTGSRFAVNLSASVAANPTDEDDVRPDGTYVGAVLGNWMLTAGWQDRWWGPSHDGSLILSTNARPALGMMMQRNISLPFESTWLRWIGPWTITSFMTELDDERAVRDARLLGIRGSFAPPNTGLEISVSRVAQWCGEDRPCKFRTFADLLVGNDNRGVNVDPEDEPGNQLGGFDFRWRLPKQVPAAVYIQWIGEDGRDGGGAIGSWLRQVGMEFWGGIGDLSHRTHFEISDTTCRAGGLGFSEEIPRCAYNHPIYQTGYRYKGKSIGHAIDGDGTAYSIGSMLVQSGGHSWNILLRYMEINRAGSSNSRHTLATAPQSIADLQITHRRNTRVGQFYAGFGLQNVDSRAPGSDGSKASFFLRWTSQ